MNIRKSATPLLVAFMTPFYITSIALIFALLSGGTAKADDLTIDCSTEGELQMALSMLLFKKGPEVAENLGNKLTNGFDKVEPPMYKYCDGAQKLKDFRITLDKLFAADPIKEKVIDTTGGEARDCLNTGTDNFIAEWTYLAHLAGDVCEPKFTRPRGPKTKEEPPLW